MEKYPQCGAYSTNYEFQQGDKVKPTILNKIRFEGEDGVLTNYFEVANCSHPPVWTSAVCVKKSLLNEIGGFPVGIKSGEDLLTWTRIAIQTDWAYSLMATAVFNVEGYEVNERPKRIPSELDYVGDELQLILKNNSTVEGLKKYVANWYKMRASVYMRLGMKRNSMKEIWKSLQLSPFNYKLYAYIVLNMTNKFKA